MTLYDMRMGNPGMHCPTGRVAKHAVGKDKQRMIYKQYTGVKGDVDSWRVRVTQSPRQRLGGSALAAVS